MPIRFVRMVQFTRLVKAEGRLREFNFRKIKNPDQECFHVNVCNERGERIFFSMQKNESNWRIIPDELPEWISKTETYLNEAIEEELRNG
jgi:hypothetical protein